MPETGHYFNVVQMPNVICQFSFGIWIWHPLHLFFFLIKVRVFFIHTTSIFTFLPACLPGYFLAAFFYFKDYVRVCSVTSLTSDSLRPHGLEPVRLLRPWDSPGKNPGVGCHALLQGVFPPQGSSPPAFQGLSPALQADYWPQSHWGGPFNENRFK